MLLNSSSYILRIYSKIRENRSLIQKLQKWEMLSPADDFSQNIDITNLTLH